MDYLSILLVSRNEIKQFYFSSKIFISSSFIFSPSNYNITIARDNIKQIGLELTFHNFGLNLNINMFNISPCMMGAVFHICILSMEKLPSILILLHIL